MREPRSSPSRRGIPKGVVADALAANFACAPVANQADADLLALGHELEVAWSKEQAAVEEADRLANVAERIREAPADVLLAYHRDGVPLFRFEAGVYRINLAVFAHVRDMERVWRVCGFREGPCPEAELLPHLATWKAGRDKAWEASGTFAADEERERLSEVRTGLCNRIVAMRAGTVAGIAVKLRALSIVRGDGPDDDWIGDVVTSPGFSTAERAAFSTLRDALAILGVRGSHG
jgi:hypothetical protein